MNTPAATPTETRTVKPAPKAPKASEITAPTVKVQTAPADAALLAELAALRAENAQLTAKVTHAAKISLKVSEKGGLSLYGLGRFPVTLYKEQWTRLLGHVDEIRAFLAAHDAELHAKGDAR
jgi:hypothetical protein